MAQKPIDVCETLPKNNIYNNIMLASSINKKRKLHLKSVERRSTAENLEVFLDGKQPQIICGVQCSFLFLFNKYDKWYNAQYSTVVITPWELIACLYIILFHCEIYCSVN